MSEKIVIIDYEMGNLNSVKKKLEKIGYTSIFSSNKEEIIRADKIILPGVGHFKKAIENLHKLNLIEVLNEAVLKDKKPILGICLGMQIMTLRSEEGNVNGLGWIDADVKKFQINGPLKYKVPHMGWNGIKKTKESRLMKDIPDDAEFYFVHSYYLNAKDSNLILNETVYETSFASAIEKENIFGVQYHPEKSHDVGKQLLKNFLEL